MGVLLAMIVAISAAAERGLEVEGGRVSHAEDGPVLQHPVLKGGHPRFCVSNLQTLFSSFAPLVVRVIVMTLSRFLPHHVSLQWCFQRGLA